MLLILHIPTVKEWGVRVDNGKVAFVEEPETADRTVIEPDGGSSSDVDDSETTAGESADSEEAPDVGLVESNVDKDTADKFGTGLRDRSATVEGHYHSSTRSENLTVVSKVRLNAVVIPVGPSGSTLRGR
jgi:hypothetical protein